MSFNQCLEFYQISHNIFLGDADKLKLKTLKANNITHVVDISQKNMQEISSEFNHQKENYLSIGGEKYYDPTSDLTDIIIKNYKYLDNLLNKKEDDRIVVGKETNVGILIINNTDGKKYVLQVKNKLGGKWMIPISKINEEETIVDDKVIEIFKKETGLDFPDYEIYKHYDYSYHQFTNNKKYNILQIIINNNYEFNGNYNIEQYPDLKWSELDYASLKHDCTNEDYEIIVKCLKNMKLNLKNQHKSIVEIDYQSNKEQKHKDNVEIGWFGTNTKEKKEQAIQTENIDFPTNNENTEKAIQTENIFTDIKKKDDQPTVKKMLDGLDRVVHRHNT